MGGASLEPKVTSNLELVLSQNKELRDANDRLRDIMSGRDQTFSYPTTGRGTPVRERVYRSGFLQDDISGISPGGNLKSSKLSAGEELSIRKNIETLTLENLDLRKQLNLARDELTTARERTRGLEDRLKGFETEREGYSSRDQEMDSLRNENRALIQQSNTLISDLEKARLEIR